MMNFLCFLFILFFTFNQSNYSKFLGMQNKTFYKNENEDEILNPGLSEINALKIRMLIAGIEQNPGPTYNVTKCSKCSLKYNILKIGHCEQCCICYNINLQHCCKCKKNRKIREDDLVSHCVKCCKDYDSSFFHCCCGYSKSLLEIKQTPYLNHCCKCGKIEDLREFKHCKTCCFEQPIDCQLKHCCECFMSYDSSKENHCCKCKKIWNINTHTHKCCCNNEISLDKHHCDKCCFTHDLTEKIDHCCKHNVFWEKEKKMHCCNCNVIYDEEFAHCCKCKKHYDSKINNHCSVCCCNHEIFQLHCCCCRNIWGIGCDSACVCDEIERKFFDIVSRDLEEKKMQQNFLLSRCITKCLSSVFFTRGLQTFSFSSMNDFLSNPENFTICYHGTPSISGAFNICCESWNLKFRGRCGQVYGTGEYFTSCIKTAKEYAKQDGAIVLAIIPNSGIGTKIKKHNRDCDEIWYVVNNDVESHYVFPVGIIECVMKIPEIYECQQITEKNNIVLIREKINDPNFALYFEGDSKKTEYDKNILGEIIEQIKNNNFLFDVTINSNQYTINFKKMKQINKLSRYERNIYLN